MKKLLIYSPRILTILFILFISLFALDAFNVDERFIKKLGGFIIHLAPTFVLTVLLIISWRREWIGAIAFLILGVLYLFIAWGKFPVSTYFIISGPLFVIAILFGINWLSQPERA